MAENLNLMVSVNVIFSAIIAFGVVYNSARVSLSERSRELASLRVLGFTRREIGAILDGDYTVEERAILDGELAALTSVSLPLGAALGYALGRLIMLMFNNEVYRLPFVVTPQTVAWTFLTVIASAAVSSLAVRRRLERLDLVGVLKTRE